MRTTRAINEASRWTPSPRQGWRVNSARILVIVIALLVAGRWGAFIGLVAWALGSWVAERLAPAKPDLDLGEPRRH